MGEPTSARERVLVLDVLRGIALCGVLIGNFFWLYSGRAWLGDPPANRLDEPASWFVEIFVESKAQTLLCFLFGFGFAAQLVRAEARGESATGLYVRRMLALFAIGCVHILSLWWGDVTWGYAIGGFGLLAFQRASNRVRVIAAFVLIFVPILVCSIPAVRNALVSLVLAPGAGKHMMGDIADAQKHGSYLEVSREHVLFALFWQVRIYGWYYFWMIGRFLLGYVAGAQRWFADDGAHRLPLFRRILVVAAPFAAANAAMQIAERLGALERYELSLPAHLGMIALEQAGYVAMAAVYMSGTVLLIQRTGWRRALSIFAPAGRMPLTTYLTQSLVCVTLCYGWGFGAAGHLGPAAILGIALAIFSVQVIVANLWLRYFRFGPAEWVWRTLVYGKLPAMRA